MRSMISVAAALAALAFSVPATAGERHDFQTWLSRAVQDNMVFPRALEQSHAQGVATVRFLVDGSGRPTAVSIVEGSGNHSIDRAALRTIETLALPANAPAGPHLAVLQYGTEVSLDDASANARRLNAALGRAQLAMREMAAARQAYAATGRSAAAPSTID